MQVCILEWITGGGLHGSGPLEVPGSLRQEGWQMLECLCGQFSAAGHRVTTVIESRLVDSEQRQRLAQQVECLLDFRPASSPGDHRLRHSLSVDATLRCWQAIALQNEVTLIVAPEIDGVLEACIEQLVQAGVDLLNCKAGFLKVACDKLLTASALRAQGLAHPPTWLASDFLEEQLKGAKRWCVKPRWGAGCDQLRVFEADGLKRELPKLRTETHALIQPWIEGKTFSMSAVVNFQGHARWLPLVTQEFAIEDRHRQGEQLRYCGARIAPVELQGRRPSNLLKASLRALGGRRVVSPLRGSVTRDSTAGGSIAEGSVAKGRVAMEIDLACGTEFGAGPCEALGWVGFDLVLDPLQNWTLIEVNPRMTTSAVELCRSGAVQLAHQLLSGYNGRLDVFPSAAIHKLALDSSVRHPVLNPEFPW